MSPTNSLIDKITKQLTEYQRYNLPKVKRNAAVLFPIICHNDQISVILTKRSRYIPQHAGEISFPGGMQNGNDEPLENTALRETCEEIGICDDNIQIVGKLDDEISLAGYRVTPFVGIIKTPSDKIDYLIDSDEVEQILTVPLIFFTKKETAWTETWVRNNDQRTVYFYRYYNHIIWGLTGRIIHKAIKILNFHI